MDISDIWFNVDYELCELYEGLPPNQFILEKWVDEMKRCRQRWIPPFLRHRTLWKWRLVTHSLSFWSLALTWLMWAMIAYGDLTNVVIKETDKDDEGDEGDESGKSDEDDEFNSIDTMTL